MITLRPAVTEDIPSLMQLIKNVVPIMQASGNFQWDEHYPNAEVFQNDIDKEQLWIALAGERLAGVAALTTDQEPEYAQVGWDLNDPAIVTHRLAVDPEFRGRGIAVALLEMAEQIALQRNISVLRIDTNTANEATKTLFPKLGYQFAGEIGLSFRPGLRFFCYEKRLRQD